MSTIEITNLSMTYDNGFQALNDVSLTAGSGQFITLLGPSGCGKTTLLKLIAGFLSPTQGEIRLNGTDIVNLPPEKRDTVMVFQSYALFPHMSVRDNITFGLKQKRLSRREQAARVEDVLSYVSLANQIDKRPKALSGGQQQRVALARALAMRSGVILFDEPLSNLDAKLREQVRFEIRKLQRDHGFTAIYVTHDQSEALAMSDVVYLMRDGQIEQSGSPHEIYRKPRNRFVADFLGVANIISAEIVETLPNSFYHVQTPYGLLTIHSEDPPVSQHVYICWRPEDVRRIGENESAQNCIELQVDTSIFLGNLTDVLAHLPDKPEQNYRLQFLQYQAIESGSRLKIALEPHHLRFLEAVE